MKKQDYQTPLLDIVNVGIEDGIAASGTVTGLYLIVDDNSIDEFGNATYL